MTKASVYATLALVLAVCGWFTDNRLLANAGLVFGGLVAALVYRRMGAVAYTGSRRARRRVRVVPGLQRARSARLDGLADAELYRCDLC